VAKPRRVGTRPVQFSSGWAFTRVGVTETLKRRKVIFAYKKLIIFWDEAPDSIQDCLLAGKRLSNIISARESRMNPLMNATALVLLQSLQSSTKAARVTVDYLSI
jgi:hypothetical protein